MKKLLLVVVVALLVAMPAAAQFQQIVQVQVKPGHEMAYESFIKKVAEAADKTGSSVSWSTFQVAVGKPLGTYRIGLLFETWGERDSWQAVPQMLAEAYGEEEGMKIFSEGASHVASSMSRVWEVVDEGTANPVTITEPAPLYTVTIRYVKREMVNEYRGLLRRFKSAYENADSKPNVTRWVLRVGEGQGTTFRRTQPFDSWSARDDFNAGELIDAQFGPDAPLLFDRMSKAVWKAENFVSAYRADLSRTAPPTTSND